MKKVFSVVLLLCFLCSSALAVTVTQDEISFLNDYAIGTAKRLLSWRSMDDGQFNVQYTDDHELYMFIYQPDLCAFDTTNPDSAREMLFQIGDNIKHAYTDNTYPLLATFILVSDGQNLVWGVATDWLRNEFFYVDADRNLIPVKRME